MNFKEPILRVDYKNQVTTELTNNTNTDSEPTSNQNLWVNIEDVMKIAETDKWHPIFVPENTHKSSYKRRIQLNAMEEFEKLLNDKIKMFEEPRNLE